MNSIVDIDSNQLFKILDIGPEAHKALKIVYKNESLVMPALSDHLVGLFRQSEKTGPKNDSILFARPLIAIMMIKRDLKSLDQFTRI